MIKKINITNKTRNEYEYKIIDNCPLYGNTIFVCTDIQ